jgi:hypothetical protein
MKMQDKRIPLTTTLNDKILKRAKMLAIAESKNLNSIIEESLLLLLNERKDILKRYVSE